MLAAGVCELLEHWQSYRRKLSASVDRNAMLSVVLVLESPASIHIAVL